MAIRDLFTHVFEKKKSEVKTQEKDEDVKLKFKLTTTLKSANQSFFLKVQEVNSEVPDSEILTSVDPAEVKSPPKSSMSELLDIEFTSAPSFSSQPIVRFFFN